MARQSAVRAQESGLAGFGAALAQLAGNGTVVAGQGRRQLFGNHAHVCKYFDADPFFQGKMGGVFEVVLSNGVGLVGQTKHQIDNDFLFLIFTVSCAAYHHRT